MDFYSRKLDYKGTFLICQYFQLEKAYSKEYVHLHKKP